MSSCLESQKKFKHKLFETHPKAILRLQNCFHLAIRQSLKSTRNLASSCRNFVEITCHIKPVLRQLQKQLNTIVKVKIPKSSQLVVTKAPKRASQCCKTKFANEFEPCPENPSETSKAIKPCRKTSHLTTIAHVAIGIFPYPLSIG